MNKILLTSSLCLVLGLANAQDVEQNSNEKVTVNSLGQTVSVSQAVTFMKTPPTKEWPIVSDEPIPMDQQIEVPKNENRGRYLDAQTVDHSEVVNYQDLQTDNYGEKNTRAPIVNVNGMNGSGYPPDPSGAAGVNYYVQAINSSYRIYNKDGSVVPGALGGGPFALGTLFGTGSDGDPIVMYDRHADRWFISQFQISGNNILIAVSETNDPTGSYYAYSFSMGSSFPDYPKYSIWWDGYYMTSNSTNTAVVFERDKMLAGDPTAQMVKLSLPSLGNFGFRSPLSADADGALPPNGTPCYFFNLEDNAMSGVSQDQIEIYEMNTDWVTPGNTNVASSQILPVTAFDAFFSGGWSNIAQPGTSQGLDAIMGVFMYRAQHMRWSGYNTIILSHAVDLGSNRSAVRWYELRDANNGVWSVYQSGTYAPDNTSRWMSSMAMDNYGNIGMGYSISDATSVYPGLAYTGRLFSDPLGTMTQGENIAIAGTASQTVTDRYGDYAHMTLDPDGSTFWYTGEWLSGSQRKTRIFSFKLANVGIDELNPYYDNLTMLAYQNESDLVVRVDGIHNNEKVNLDIIAMNGKAVQTVYDLQPNDSKLDQKVNISKLESGVYFVRIGNPNFQEVKRLFIKN